MKLSKRSLIRGTAFALAMGATAIALVLALTRTELNWRSLAAVRLLYLALAGGLMAAAWLVRAWRLQIFCRAIEPRRFSIWRLLQIYLSTCFISQVTPTTTGGLPLQIYLLAREGLSAGESIAVTVLDSFLTTIFFVVVGPVLLLLWRNQVTLSGPMAHFFNFFLLGVFGLCTLTIYLIRNPEWVGRLLVRLTAWRGWRRLDRRGRLARLGQHIMTEVERYHKGIRLIASHRRSALWLAVFNTLIYWALYLAIAPVILMGLGVRLQLLKIMAAQLFLNFIQPFFPTPGASGGAELSFAYFLRGAVPAWALGFYVLLWRVITYYFSLVLGGLALLAILGRGWLEREEVTEIPDLEAYQTEEINSGSGGDAIV